VQLLAFIGLGGVSFQNGCWVWGGHDMDCQLQWWQTRWPARVSGPAGGWGMLRLVECEGPGVRHENGMVRRESRRLVWLSGVSVWGETLTS